MEKYKMFGIEEDLTWSLYTENKWGYQLMGYTVNQGEKNKEKKIRRKK